MDPKAQSAANPVYEDFDPFFEWRREAGSDTLIVMLPGFRRDQLKVQVTSTSVLKLSAQRQISEKKWRRVYKEFPVPSDCDTDELSAKFEGGTLYVKFPKVTIPSKPQPQEIITAKPSQSERVDEQNGAKEDQAKAKTKPLEEEKEKGKTEVDGSDGTQNKIKTNGVEKLNQEAVASKAHDEKPRAKPFTRSKTRVLDFTLSLRPTADQDCEEAVSSLVMRLKKTKKLVSLIMVASLVVVLVAYFKNEIKSSLGGSKFQEL